VAKQEASLVEFPVLGHDDVAMPGRVVPHGIVRGARQADVANVRRSREEVSQGSNQPGREVLVEQEPHAGGSAIRRRSRSAANARHARMSSGVRSGKSRRISSWDIPDAR
jgi:hypothetical protein